MSSNEPRDQLAGFLAAHLYDRGEYVADWPADEQALHRGNTWTDFRDRAQQVQRLRYEKAADALLADTELLDRLITRRQMQRLAEHAPGLNLPGRLRAASESARRSEFHWPADCLAEAADVLEELARERAALFALADRWATQGNDYDEDTEQQIADGRELLALLGEEASSDG